jgi:hypothetical protein
VGENLRSDSVYIFFLTVSWGILQNFNFALLLEFRTNHSSPLQAEQLPIKDKRNHKLTRSSESKGGCGVQVPEGWGSSGLHRFSPMVL